MTRTTRVLLVRHGQSTWNALGRWQGQADVPLSELGERQAAVAARAVPDEAWFWASDLQRARRTAEILRANAPATDPAGDLLPTDPLLRERDAGEWTGLTHGEIEDRWPGWLEARRRPARFEADDTVVARVLAALERIRSQHRERASDGVVLAVTHGGVVRALERSLGVEAPPLPNLGGRWFELREDVEPVPGDRVLLVDPDEVAVTVPGST